MDARAAKIASDEAIAASLESPEVKAVIALIESRIAETSALGQTFFHCRLGTPSDLALIDPISRLSDRNLNALRAFMSRRGFSFQFNAARGSKKSPDKLTQGFLAVSWVGDFESSENDEQSLEPHELEGPRNAELLLPAWFSERMLSDVWIFGILLNTGVVLVVDSIDDIVIDAGGTLWLDVNMAEKDVISRELMPGFRLLYSPTSRNKASVNVSQIVAVFELADS